MLKALDSYHLFIKGIKVVPEVPSSETNAFGEKSIFGASFSLETKFMESTKD